MSAPKIIVELVERFLLHKEAYQANSYNETQVRREFIDPFFKALGWDVDNEQGYAEAYKDVVHEDAVKIGGNTKAPDYAFRVGGTRKFFLEAKKPAVNIKLDVGPAFQLRRYAWSAKLPLSILTDFEELAVYDCRIKPEKTDKASVARTAYYTFDEYLDKWDEIADIFSREAVLKGSFDKYASDNRRKRGTAEVDDAFLEEIEGWRAALARNIALRNRQLDVRELNAAVQRIIDRIVFLRIAEDRGIEKYGQLQALAASKDVYDGLTSLFRKADDRYNSGLFHFKKGDGSNETLDTFTLDLTIDDKVLNPILNSLYYPESPYEFSVLPADILGQVYERFLGKVIRLAGTRAVIEEKPEVKKAGGVYYTPAYIVDYIVQNTLGKLLEGKTPSQASGEDRRTKDPAPLRVVDPACGSGSFLIGAYQYLLDWYRDAYVSDDPAKYTGGKEPRLLEAGKDDWRLTIAERRRILLTHIYGVDIDTQAVEVTKLSLLLKVLEGETADAMARQMDFFRIRALPDLGQNIRCGNSLIESDFYKTYSYSLFSDDDHIAMNVFDWETEFPFLRQTKGFDCVIGKPP
jgi:type I restriction-modification system DNA methylase subunit